MKSLRGILIVVFGFFVLLVYQNCSDTSKHSQGLTAKMCGISDLLSNCEQKKLKAFESTYYSILQNKCAGCHSNGPGIGRFANEDSIVAWTSFNSIGKVKIVNQALNLGHQPGFTGPENQQALDQAELDYSQNELEFQACQSNSLANCGSEGNKKYQLFTHMKNLELKDTWTTMTFTYPGDFEVKVNDLDGKVMSFSIQYRINKVDGQINGFQTRRPTLLTTDNLKVESLQLKLNGKVDPYLTTYQNLNGYVTTTDSSLIETESEVLGILYDETFDASKQNSLSVVLENIQFQTKPESPSDNGGGGDIPVEEIPDTTFAELTGSGGIFKKHCQSCHSPSGGRTPYITSSTLEQLKSGDFIKPNNSLGSEIYQRMTDPVSPMPPTGPLSSLERNTVKKWIDSGAQ